jgi:hypothetical protein
VLIEVPMIAQRARRRMLLGGLVVLAGAFAAPASAIEIEATADRPSVHVGEAVTITVRALRADTLAEPPPLRAYLNVGSEWQPTRQSVASQRPGESGAAKSWEFQLVAIAPGKTQVFPVVVTTDRSGQPGSTLPVNGAPVAVEILPESIVARRLPVIVGVIAAGGAALLVALRLRRRATRRKRHQLPPPLTEALGMMEEIRAHCREDRAVRFLSDLDKVVHGYLVRRLERPLAGSTAAEIVRLVSPHIAEQELVAALEELLRRCGTIKYAGWRGTFGDLETTAQLARDTLERLDRAWVTSDSPSAHSPDPEH